MRGTHDYDAIWRETGPTLWRALFAYAGGRRDVADDAIAEAFARAIERGSSVRDPVPYLYRVAFRVASADLKARGTQENQVERTIEANPDGLVDLLGALRRLSPAQRASVYLHYQADLPVREVARLTGMSSAAVKVHLSRGRRRLAALLGEEEE